MQHRSPGFTLIEMLVVVAIISILAAIAIPQFQFFEIRSKRTAALAFFSLFGKSQKAFYAAKDEFAPAYYDWGTPPHPGAGTSINGGVGATFNNIMNVLGMPSFSALTSSKAYRFHAMQFQVMYSNTHCLEQGLKNDRTCGYMMRACVDRDRQPILGSGCWSNDDVIVVRDNTTKTFTGAAYPGPPGSTPYLLYDDLLNAYLY